MSEWWQKIADGDGEILDAAGSSAFLADDPDCIYRVAAGKIDIFAVPVRNGQPDGARSHLFQLEAGSVVFGFPREAIDAAGMGILVSGAIGSKLQRMPRSKVRLLEREADHMEALACHLDTWLVSLSAALLQGKARKVVDQKLMEGSPIVLKAGQSFNADKGVLWVKPAQGHALFLGLEAYPVHAQGSVLKPVTERSWFTAGFEGPVEGIRSKDWLSIDPLWKGLDGFHAGLLAMICDRIAESDALECERMARKAASDQAAMASSISGLASLLGSGMQTGLAREEDPLLAVCRKVAEPLGITIVPPPPSVDLKNSRNPLADIVRSSRIRTRRVALRGTWWKQDNGPMVAFRGNGAVPVALLPKNARSYLLYDPSGDDEPEPLTREVAESLDPFAYVLYRSFSSKVLTGKDIISFAFQGRSTDLAIVLVTGLACGLLGLATPIATGVIFDTIIPGAQLNQLLMLSMALMVGAVSAAVFEFTKSIAILRLEGRMDQHVQSAVWDRLLELPVPFFRGYSAGDLADRAMGINAVRQTLSGTTVNAILSGIFTIFNLALLFWYSVKLAFAAVAITLVAIVVLAISSRYQLRYQKQLAEIGGKISGFVLETITGIAKFRVSGSEQRVFARWAARFSEQRSLAKKSRMIQNGVETFSNVYPVISTMIIFVMIVWYTEKAPLSTGDFLAFNASFSQFLQAVLAIATSVISSLSVMPHYQRFKPILETLPETDTARAHPGELTGAIEISRLSFRYAPDGPNILNDVSLQVKPGEFVAIVGQSGSGKSTLLRLLLGFEQADAGAIFFDGQEISTLDIRSVRQQMGVVLQNGQLLSGDIMTNIIGSSMMTIEDAWAAARMAGFEEDIKAMPMGMHTVVSQGGGGLSGGQRQRLLIARALVAKPRILFFDEATSALDNLTQAIVNSSLEKLQTTRVVIAHRLSTIMHADRIYVLDGGHLVQTGTYNELMAGQGLFAELAKRQIA